MTTCEEVKINLHDYFDDQLDKKTRREVEEHIRSCQSCLAHFNDMSLFFGRLKDLAEGVDPPDDLLKKISNELLEKSLSLKALELQTNKKDKKKKKQEKIIQEKIRKEEQSILKDIPISKKINDKKVFRKQYFGKRLALKKTLKTIFPLLLIVLGYSVYQYLQINTPWQLDIERGFYTINGKEELTGKLEKEATLAAMDSSLVVVYVPQTGRIEVNGNSSFTLVEGNNKGNIVSLKRGKIKMITTALMPKFSVIVGDYQIKDIGGVFTVKLDSAGNADLFVEFGLARVFYKDYSYFVDEGYYCDFHKGKRPGVPYRFDATDSLKQFIHKFDLVGSDNNLVDGIVAQTGRSDALTLIALIPRVSTIKRQTIFQKLANFFPPPKTVTRMGIITLDQDMLNDWWNEIEWQI